MASTNYEIDTYRLYHLNADYISENEWICMITCFKGNAPKGNLKFFKEGATIPPSSKTRGGILFLRFQGNQLTDIIETLRQEKPLYIWYADSDHVGGLSTSNEPVGEEES